MNEKVQNKLNKRQNKQNFLLKERREVKKRLSKAEHKWKVTTSATLLIIVFFKWSSPEFFWNCYSIVCLYVYTKPALFVQHTTQCQSTWTNFNSFFGLFYIFIFSHCRWRNSNFIFFLIFRSGHLLIRFFRGLV